MNTMQQTIDYTVSEENIIYLAETNAVFDINIWSIILVAVFFLILIFLRRIIQKIIQRGKYAEHTIFLIRLPKDKPKENREEKTVQNLHEEIAKGETIFASIGGLRAQRGVIAWLLGRNDHFSFEIVANQKKICFYVVAPKKMARYIEQQAHAHYPEAVIEEVDDYNIFHPQGITAAGFLKTRRSFIFPLKTYDKMETDPMNSMINIISKLDEHEGIAIQYVIRSAKGGWHRKAAKVVKEVNKGKTLVYALKLNYITRGLEMLGALAKSIKPPTESEKQKELQRNPQKLSAMEEEMLKGIEEKNSKAGLDVNVRVIISAQNKGKARLYLDNISSAFSQYNHYEYGNCFKNQISRRRENTIINHFIYRYFDNRTSFLLNTEELASMFHFPLPGSETPNILWLTAKHAAAPTNIPDQGIILGINTYREITKDIKIKREDRRRHTYIIGKSGVGKSILLANMAIQDILNGEGVCVIDPHGDLIQDVLRRVPPERAEDVILFAPADIERPLALNLLEYDSKYPEQKTFVINEMIKIFDKLYDLKATGGPIFEQYMRNALLLIMDSPESGSTLMEVPKVLADVEFRKMKIEKCKDPTVVDFWKKEAEKAGGDAALANIVPYITSKLTQFISNDTMRPIIAQQNSSFNLRSIMDKQKILLVDLSKGQVGEMNAFLLGMILVGKILMSALSRSDMPQEKRKDFYLYIDEFQNFTTDSICSILSEARKYSLNLIMAHQYLGQLVKNQDTSIKDAVFGNVGTWILFKIGSEDAEVMEKEFAPVFNQYDLINIEKYTAYVKLLVDNTASRPFSMKTLWPLTGIEREDMANKIKSLSRLKYGQDRNMIEAEIMSRSPSPVIS
ncbi:type IV secretion system DNA-binding domain-containing protein [Patescibacteria group bacterium]|nr:type IV secretion system DNA-binding domain-containing protein [Patescibacteria group bacterium]MBU2474829.1 type IV secretion system DNA-binding domain-containing protein [Patescibacteria group bacterium]